MSSWWGLNPATKSKIDKAIDNVVYGAQFPEYHVVAVREAEQLFQKLNALGVNYWHHRMMGVCDNV